MLDHHHRVGAARDNAAGGDHGRGAGHDLDRRLHAASHDLGVERKPPRRAVAGADDVGGAQCEAVDVGAIERRRVDRRNRVGCQHAGERSRQRDGLAVKRRAVDTGLEASPRLGGGNHFEKLFLARGAAHRIENRRAFAVG